MSLIQVSGWLAGNTDEFLCATQREDFWFIIFLRMIEMRKEHNKYAYHRSETKEVLTSLSRWLKLVEQVVLRQQRVQKVQQWH